MEPDDLALISVVVVYTCTHTLSYCTHVYILSDDTSCLGSYPLTASWGAEPGSGEWGDDDSGVLTAGWGGGKEGSGGAGKTLCRNSEQWEAISGSWSGTTGGKVQMAGHKCIDRALGVGIEHRGCE